MIQPMPEHPNPICGYLIYRQRIITMYWKTFSIPIRTKMALTTEQRFPTYDEISNDWKMINFNMSRDSVLATAIQNTFLSRQYNPNNGTWTQVFHIPRALDNTIVERVLNHPDFCDVFRKVPGDPTRSASIVRIVEDAGRDVADAEVFKVYAAVCNVINVANSFNVCFDTGTYRCSNDFIIKTLLNFVMTYPKFITGRWIMLTVEHQYYTIVMHDFKEADMKKMAQAVRFFMDKHARRFISGV